MTVRCNIYLGPCSSSYGWKEEREKVLIDEVVVSLNSSFYIFAFICSTIALFVMNKKEAGNNLFLKPVIDKYLTLLFLGSRS